MVVAKFKDLEIFLTFLKISTLKISENYAI